MLTDNRVLVKSGGVATMSVAVLMFVASNAAGADQLSGGLAAAQGQQPYLNTSFVSSTANDVSISNYSKAEMDDLVATINGAYTSFAAKQHRLDSHMEEIVAGSLWDLYITD